jgi:polysaccharide chain length determinant protein (PEP-CTERM system associated)
MLGHRELSFEDYLAILRRRRWVIIIPVVLGPLIAFGISLKLHSQYTSQTLVLVEQQKVPDRYVKAVVTEDLNARLGTMQGQILSRTRLQPIIEKFGLYKDEIGQVPMEDLVDELRKAISILPVKSVVSTREGDMPGFYLAFTTDNPRVAQQVCAEITSMFISEDLRLREQTTEGTTSFLENTLADAKREMDGQDAKLAEFKRRNLGALPDETQTNLNLLASLNTQLAAATQSLNRAQQDKVYLESLLAQQVAASEALRAGNSPHPETNAQQLASMENELLFLEAKYTSDHPDVVKLKAAIEQLKEKNRATANTAKGNSAEKVEKASGPEPPQIQQLRSQLHAYEEAIKQHTREQERVKQQIQVYQGRVQTSPVVEQEYKQLTRDYQTALDFYNDLLKKRNQSEMATNLERRQQGEQFRVLDSANLPEKPSFPNRPLFAGGGLAGGLALGVALAVLLEMRDKSLRTEADISFYLGVPALAVVPTVGNMGKGKGRWHVSAKKGTTQPRQTVEA